jgi:hypothetical protein
MPDTAYRHALVDAGIIATGSAGGGITLWREHGLHVAQLMVDQFVAEAGRMARVARVEHPFLQGMDAYERVFPDYRNVYRLPSQRHDGSDLVLRADNLHLNVAWLRDAGHRGPVVTTSGLLRRLRGGGAPLFRDRYIWPAVQLNHELPAGQGPEALQNYREVLERTFAAFSLPVLTIDTDALSFYGDTCHLTVSCLRDGRPTVVATTYLMAARYRKALGVDGELVDIGFTGKALALVAMHHRDGWGLGLPSALAPAQVGVLAPGAEAEPAVESWERGLAGLRTRVTTGLADVPFRRRRAERALLRAGIPLAYGVGADGEWRMVRRAPASHGRAPAWPTAEAVRTELDSYDRRLLHAAAGRMARGIERTGLVRGVCDECAAGRTPRSGCLVPYQAARCAGCGGDGAQSFVSEQGRFY